ncbi:homoserine kinase [Cellulomonas fimi]|uniref:Homoserine kinase n=1 Tax=Cellulomonas fimi TaxID=1708 RepID=A0A7Y0LXX8_CELFI|nr:homoserine kinase [Cellulomonas fimi]NMR19941.1 homoserine kinase [Cellulomonas fimi]
MRLGSDHVRVVVPATAANLGPGFDSLGLALGIHDELEVRALGSPDVVVEVTGEGAREVPDDDTHLVVRALRLALDHVGAPQTGVHLTCTNRIPHGRGLGSSAAAAVAGILAARGLIADPEALDDAVALRLANELEGHPDNAAPALLGGATVAWCDVDGPHAVRLEPADVLTPVLLVPPDRLATSHARSVLPTRVPHGDAAFQAGRAALLVEALTRRPDLLLPATEDMLHQQYRAAVMAQTLGLVGALRERGVAAVVSGAGPTVLVLARAAAAGAGTDADDVISDVLAEACGDWQVVSPGVDGGGAHVARVGR